MILRLCYTFLQSTADAEDICQDVLLKILTSDIEFSSSEHEKAWIIRATSNACKDLLKSARYTRVRTLDQDLEVMDERDEFEPVSSSVDCSVEQLPSKYREVIYLRYYEGYSSKEIAELTNQSVEAVYQQLSRARKLLKSELVGEYA
ncbi:MAG: RNA polymerase sigma factor [Atopobiaceae bacterium]|nr:RNA polymerase sigma factor [Atopobiaceae bacterium]